MGSSLIRGRYVVCKVLDKTRAQMIESGVTTVQHLHSRVNGPAQRIHAAASHVIKAYQDIGMRVSYSFGLRDQNRFVYAPDEQFIARLPADLGAEVAELLRTQAIPLEENFSLFEQLYGEHRGAERVRIQLAPVNLHWCSDRALTMVKNCADKYDVPMHMHLLETRYQKEYARRRTGATAVRHLQSLGLLGPNLTLGHGVWVTEPDIDLIAETGTCVCHNASSNLRLRSGIAPLNPLAERGVRVAIGLDARLGQGAAARTAAKGDACMMSRAGRGALRVIADERRPALDGAVPRRRSRMPC